MLMAACNPALCPNWGFRYYLRRGQNPFRWVEYSISAGIMHIE